MSVPAEFEGDIVSEDEYLDALASRIREEYQRSKDAISESVDAGIAIGQCLKEARAALPSDKAFGQWFKAQEFKFTNSWALVLRTAAEHEAAVRAVLASQLASSGQTNLEKAVKEASKRLAPKPVAAAPKATPAADPIDVEALTLSPETINKAAGDVEPGDVVIDSDGNAHPIASVEEQESGEVLLLDLDGDYIATDKDERLPVTKPDLGNGVSHPARFSDALLDRFAEVLKDYRMVLDPFAGTGRIHELEIYDHVTVGVELEPEWAKLHENTMVGDALALPFEDEEFDAICTSPTYGNRLADHHNAVDPHLRRSYTHDLGRTLTEGNSGVMHWGPDYRDFHAEAWLEAFRVLRYGGRFVLNIKDHIRGGVHQPVAAWHVATLVEIGLTFNAELSGGVPTQHLKQGANDEERVGQELVLVFSKSFPS